MDDHEIQLLQHELFLLGVNMNVPVAVHHMDLDKALYVCFHLNAGYTFHQAIDAYDKDVI